MTTEYWYGAGRGQTGDAGTTVEALGDSRYRVIPQGYRQHPDRPTGELGWFVGPSRVVTAPSPREALIICDCLGAYEEETTP